MIVNIEQAEHFIKNLKRSNNNWVSDESLLLKLEACKALIDKHQREDLLPYFCVNACLYYIDNGDFGPALENAELAEKHAEKYSNYECLLNALSLLYRVQRFLGNLETAQIIVNRQIDIALEYSDPHLIGAAYFNQGGLSHRLGLIEECIEACEKSIEFIRKSGETYYTSMFQIAFSGMLLDFGLPEKAEKFLEEGYAIALENNFIHQQALAKSNFGLLYQLKNKETSSIQAFHECIALYKQLNNVSDMVTGKIMLADALVQFNQTKEAEKILKDAIDFSENNKLKYNQIGIYEALSNLYENIGNYKDSLHYLKQLIKVKEEYLSAESEKRIRNLEVTQRIKILKMEKTSAELMANIKHDFLANMSHEIRTPINSILGICYLLQQRELDELSLNYVRRLHRSGENLLGIINDVLDISKIESGKMELNNEVFLIDEVINDIYNALEPKAIDKDLKFKIIKRYKNQRQVVGDKIRLYQVLLNIVSNAIKFTNTGNVTLLIDDVETDARETQLVFTVKDTGIGIAKDKINTIFERYEQADASIKNSFGGTGLGLSISKKIVELMHGTIEINSTLNKGTQFIISIPFAFAAPKPEDTSINIEISPEVLNNKTILIADDNEENRLVAKEILLDYNKTIKIMEAADGNEVIALLFKKIPDILFIDLDMPNLNGIETTQLIRKNKKYDKIKIIGNTASLSTFSDAELKEIGFDGFLQKPYKIEALITLCLSKK